MPINRECPKCGHQMGVTYHPTDMMEMQCGTCRYTYYKDPLDKRKPSVIKEITGE